MDEVVVVLLIVAGVAARIVSVAKRGYARTIQASGKGMGGPPPETMSELLAEMRSQLEGARRKQQVEARTTLPTPVAKSTRTRAAMVKRPLRAEPVDVMSVRPPPVQVDYDAEAARLVAARFAAAEAMAKGRSPADHAAFDQRTRLSQSVASAPQPHRLARLRTAVIWQEILGPPVSLRPPPD